MTPIRGGNILQEMIEGDAKKQRFQIYFSNLQESDGGDGLSTCNRVRGSVEKKI